MSFIADLVRAGFWPMRHENEEYEPALRLVRFGAIIDTDPSDPIPMPRTRFQGKEESRGDVLGVTLWPASKSEQRPDGAKHDREMPGWNWAWPAIVTDSPAAAMVPQVNAHKQATYSGLGGAGGPGGGGVFAEHPAGRASRETFERAFEDRVNTSGEGLSNQSGTAGGSSGGGAKSSSESSGSSSQSGEFKNPHKTVERPPTKNKTVSRGSMATVMPLYRDEVADKRFAELQFKTRKKLPKGTRGVVLGGTKEGGAQAQIFLPVDEGRLIASNIGAPDLSSDVYETKKDGSLYENAPASLHSTMRVVDVQAFPDLPDGEGKSLAWQLGPSGQDQIPGWALCVGWATPEDDGPAPDPTVPAATATGTTPDGKYGERPAKGDKGGQNNKPGQNPRTQGKKDDEKKKPPKMILAVGSEFHGGPFAMGHENDVHRATGIGPKVNPLHLATKALFIGTGGDGPLAFERGIHRKANKYPSDSLVHLKFEPGGIWTWHAEVPTYVPDIPQIPNDPPFIHIGKDGKNGKDGKDGRDGKPGVTGGGPGKPQAPPLPAIGKQGGPSAPGLSPPEGTPPAQHGGQGGSETPTEPSTLPGGVINKPGTARPDFGGNDGTTSDDTVEKSSESQREEKKLEEYIRIRKKNGEWVEETYTGADPQTPPGTPPPPQLGTDDVRTPGNPPPPRQIGKKSERTGPGPLRPEEVIEGMLKGIDERRKLQGLQQGPAAGAGGRTKTDIPPIIADSTYRLGDKTRDVVASKLEHVLPAVLLQAAPKWDLDLRNYTASTDPDFLADVDRRAPLSVRLEGFAKNTGPGDVSSVARKPGVGRYVSGTASAGGLYVGPPDRDAYMAEAGVTSAFTDTTAMVLLHRTNLGFGDPDFRSGGIKNGTNITPSSAGLTFDLNTSGGSAYGAGALGITPMVTFNQAIRTYGRSQFDSSMSDSIGFQTYATLPTILSTTGNGLFVDNTASRRLYHFDGSAINKLAYSTEHLGLTINLVGDVTGPHLATTVVRLQGKTVPSGAPANGQILIGDGTNWAKNTITGGTGISVTNTSGVITVASNNPISDEDIAFIQGFRISADPTFPFRSDDHTSTTNIWFRPYIGNRIALHDGTSTWALRTAASVATSFAGVTPNLPHDIFAYWTGEAIAGEYAAWATATTRTTDVIWQDGVPVKSGDTTRRYMGTVYVYNNGGTKTVYDTDAFRGVWNYYHRRERRLHKRETTDTWIPTTSAVGINAGNANWKLEFVVGLAGAYQEDKVSATLSSHYTAALGSTRTGVQIGFGLDSDTPDSNSLEGLVEYPGATLADRSIALTPKATWSGLTGIGYHFLQGWEKAVVGTGASVVGFGDFITVGIQANLMA